MRISNVYLYLPLFRYFILLLFFEIKSFFSLTFLFLNFWIKIFLVVIHQYKWAWDILYVLKLKLFWFFFYCSDMRLKPGKLCNSLRSFSLSSCMSNLSCCCCLRGSGQRSAANNSSNKMTLKKQARLIYYTFFYNHHNDSITALETFLLPFVNTMTHFLKILGYVRRFASFS